MTFISWLLTKRLLNLIKELSKLLRYCQICCLLITLLRKSRQKYRKMLISRQSELSVWAIFLEIPVSLKNLSQFFQKFLWKFLQQILNFLQKSHTKYFLGNLFGNFTCTYVPKFVLHIVCPFFSNFFVNFQTIPKWNCWGNIQRNSQKNK